MLYKAYSYTSPHSPQKIYITPYILFQFDQTSRKNCEAKTCDQNNLIGVSLWGAGRYRATRLARQKLTVT